MKSLFSLINVLEQDIKYQERFWWPIINLHYKCRTAQKRRIQRHKVMHTWAMYCPCTYMLGQQIHNYNYAQLLDGTCIPEF